jgi:hypothetical protein
MRAWNASFYFELSVCSGWNTPETISALDIPVSGDMIANREGSPISGAFKGDKNMQIPTGNSRLLNFLAALVIIVGCSAPALSVTTVEVGSCVVGLVQFSTIQSAVNASPSGTIIKVCPGSYGEQVSINKRITLQGVASGTADEAVIVPPSGGLIQNANGCGYRQPPGRADPGGQPGDCHHRRSHG